MCVGQFGEFCVLPQSLILKNDTLPWINDYWHGGLVLSNCDTVVGPETFVEVLRIALAACFVEFSKPGDVYTVW
jgi:hypothetical protein